MTDILETRTINNVDYRVRLVVDEECESPRGYDCHAGVICAWSLDYNWPAEDADTIYADDIRRAIGYYSKYGDWLEGFSFRAVSRWLRMFYGATVVLPLYDAGGLSVGGPDETPRSGDYRGVTFDTATSRKNTGIPAEHMAKALTADVEEYARWGAGECYGYILERQPADPHPDCHAPHCSDEWEEVMSVWGHIGLEYAEETAREALAACE
jgi:hypothetical protein